MRRVYTAESPRAAMVHLRDVSRHTHHACTVTSSAWCMWCACGCVRDRAGHGQHGPAVPGSESSMATQLLQDFKLPRVSTNCDQPRDRFPVWHTPMLASGYTGPHVPGTRTRSTHPHVVAPSPPQYIAHKLSLLHCMPGPHALGCDLQEDCRSLL